MCAMFNLLSQRNAGHRPKCTWLREIIFVHEVGMLIICCLHGYKILFTGHEPEIANYNSSAVLKKGTPILAKSVISTYIPKRTKITLCCLFISNTGTFTGFYISSKVECFQL